MERLYKNLITNNKKWAASKLKNDSSFFENLSKSQSPEFLYIGCSDSRVAANLITNLDVGEIFLHKNIANQVKLDDNNSMSVIHFAVNVLKVKHIIVCGHYGCGGVKAVCDNNLESPISEWLDELTQLKNDSQGILNEIKGDELREKKLVELNVKAQIRKIKNIDIVKEKFEKNGYPKVHGWVYDIKDGLIKELDESKLND